MDLCKEFKEIDIQIEKLLADTLESFQEPFNWLDEVVLLAKEKLQQSERCLLPKTPKSKRAKTSKNTLPIVTEYENTEEPRRKTRSSRCQAYLNGNKKRSRESKTSNFENSLILEMSPLTEIVENDHNCLNDKRSPVAEKLLLESNSLHVMHKVPCIKLQIDDKSETNDNRASPIPQNSENAVTDKGEDEVCFTRKSKSNKNKGSSQFKLVNTENIADEPKITSVSPVRSPQNKVAYSNKKERNAITSDAVDLCISMAVNNENQVAETSAITTAPVKVHNYNEKAEHEYIDLCTPSTIEKHGAKKLISNCSTLSSGSFLSSPRKNIFNSTSHLYNSGSVLRNTASGGKPSRFLPKTVAGLRQQRSVSVDFKAFPQSACGERKAHNIVTNISSFITKVQPPKMTKEKHQELRSISLKEKIRKQEDARRKKEEILKFRTEERKRQNEERMKKVLETREALEKKLQEEQNIREKQKDEIRLKQKFRKVEEERLQRLKEEAKKAEDERNKQEEIKRIEEEKNKQEAKRNEEERRKQEEVKRIDEEKRKQEGKRIEEEKMKQAKRIEEEKRKQEGKRIEEEKMKQAKRIEEEKMKQKEVKRIKEEKRAIKEEMFKKEESQGIKDGIYANKLLDQQGEMFRKEESIKMESESRGKISKLRKITEQETPTNKHCEKSLNEAYDSESSHKQDEQRHCNSTVILNATRIMENSMNETYVTESVTPVASCDPDNYDIHDLNSSDSSDDETNPRKRIPLWATNPCLKTLVFKQYHTKVDVEKIFPPPQLLLPPNLNLVFSNKRRRYCKRTSSALWNTPPYKVFSNCF